MEFVLVVARSDLFPGVTPHGFLPAAGDSAAEVQALLDRARRGAFFMERRRAEEDPRFKQIIPYCVVHAGGKVLLLRRSARGSEQRLHSKLSIGVGGHINPIDGAEDPIPAGCLRELEEEIRFSSPPRPRFAGVLNDDTTPVGSVHVGLVYSAGLPAPDARVREEHLLEGAFVAPEELRRLAAGVPPPLETWSEMLLENLGHVMPRSG
jgi:predicted NUDIX family phosphoesterase